MEVAAEVCGGRLLMSHEGGYSSFYVPYCGLAVIEQMSGHPQRHRLRGRRARTATAPARASSRSTSAHAVDRAAANVELVPAP